MVLEGQLTLREAGSAIERSFNGRLSRIVTKLFGKVIKTEESSTSPYAPDDVNLETLFTAIADMLEAVNATESSGDNGKPCRDMAESLTISILRFRSASEVRQLLQFIDLGDSSVMGLIPNLVDETSPPKGPRPALSPSSRASSASKDVAELVSKVGSSPEGAERLAAIEALREYRVRHGDDDLISHLEKVSDAFRAYVWEQLSTVSTPGPRISADIESELPMSARIRNLRSKLHVSDLSVGDDVSQPEVQTPERTPRSALPSAATTPTRIPTPSRIPGLATPKTDKNATVLSLRQRLAAAQANRAKATEPEPAPSSPALPQGGHAAALRARLQAVKQQRSHSTLSDTST